MVCLQTTHLSDEKKGDTSSGLFQSCRYISKEQDFTVGAFFFNPYTVASLKVDLFTISINERGYHSSVFYIRIGILIESE